MKNKKKSDLEMLQNEIKERDQKIIYLDQKVLELEERLAWFTRQIFGKKSEKIVADLDREQLTFEGLNVPETSEEEKTQTVPAHQRRKPNRNGKDAITLPSDLPVRTVVLDVPEEAKVCKETGIALVNGWAKVISTVQFPDSPDCSHNRRMYPSPSGFL